MDWKYLLTSFDGRINRAKFWACVGVAANANKRAPANSTPHTTAATVAATSAVLRCLISMRTEPVW